MRMNRGTIILVVASILVIAAVLVFNNIASAPDEGTPTPASSGGGPLFEDLSAETLTRLSLLNNTDDEQTVLSKDEGGAWSIEEATHSTERATDQDAAAQAATDFASLTANDSFTAENLADFGLEEPAYTLRAEGAEETTYVVHIGNENPTGNRYYALREGDEEPIIYLLPKTSVDALLDLIAEPPYVPPPTATPTPYPTPNPYSEVEQTATAQVEQTATAEYAPTATAEFEATATAEAEATEEATEEAPEEAPAATEDVSEESDG